MLPDTRIFTRKLTFSPAASIRVVQQARPLENRAPLTVTNAVFAAGMSQTRTALAALVAVLVAVIVNHAPLPALTEACRRSCAAISVAGDRGDLEVDAVGVVAGGAVAVVGVHHHGVAQRPGLLRRHHDVDQHDVTGRHVAEAAGQAGAAAPLRLDGVDGHGRGRLVDRDDAVRGALGFVRDPDRERDGLSEQRAPRRRPRSWSR